MARGILLFLLLAVFGTTGSRAAAPDIPALQHAIVERASRVEEFKFLREEAARLGVRAWLFGGTAAAYAHYVKWDLESEGGNAKYQRNRFDYDYTNIYRSTQDLDIVIDGTPEQAKQLQKILSTKFAHLQGSKQVWEVRLLNKDMGDKLAILNNPDFLNQHSDSNSTGLIEVTKPPPGEPAVRDVMDWHAKVPHFLRDVQEGKLHYYFNPKHETTRFFREGRNPPIFSAIRFLTKAFQFELELRPEDLAKIRKIIDGFDPAGKHTDYVRNWLLKKDNGRKLVQNAVNMEYAIQTLDRLGLRQKLIEIEGNPRKEGSLAWWMSKEPLRSEQVGQGAGKTARDLGLTTVAHETSGFLAYESITKAHTGDPNVFISRKDHVGEAALYGDGFYTMQGETGGRGTGFTIRFDVVPDAREGSDFFLVEGKPGMVVFRNRKALRVIPESLDWSYRKYFDFIAEGTQVAQSDRGIYAKLERRLQQSEPDPEDARYVANLVREQMRKPGGNRALVDAWLRTKPAPELMEDFLETLAARPALLMPAEFGPMRDLEEGEKRLERMKSDLAGPRYEKLREKLSGRPGMDLFFAQLAPEEQARRMVVPVVREALDKKLLLDESLRFYLTNESRFPQLDRELAQEFFRLVEETNSPPWTDGKFVDNFRRYHEVPEAKASMRKFLLAGMDDPNKFFADFRFKMLHAWYLAVGTEDAVMNELTGKMAARLVGEALEGPESQQLEAAHRLMHLNKLPTNALSEADALRLLQSPHWHPKFHDLRIDVARALYRRRDVTAETRKQLQELAEGILGKVGARFDSEDGKLLAALADAVGADHGAEMWKKWEQAALKELRAAPYSPNVERRYALEAWFRSFEAHRHPALTNEMLRIGNVGLLLGQIFSRKAEWGTTEVARAAVVKGLPHVGGLEDFSAELRTVADWNIDAFAPDFREELFAWLMRLRKGYHHRMFQSEPFIRHPKVLERFQSMLDRVDVVFSSDLSSLIEDLDQLMQKRPELVSDPRLDELWVSLLRKMESRVKDEIQRDFAQKAVVQALERDPVWQKLPRYAEMQKVLEGSMKAADIRPLPGISKSAAAELPFINPCELWFKMMGFK